MLVASLADQKKAVHRACKSQAHILLCESRVWDVTASVVLHTTGPRSGNTKTGQGGLNICDYFRSL